MSKFDKLNQKKATTSSRKGVKNAQAPPAKFAGIYPYHTGLPVQIFA